MPISKLGRVAAALVAISLAPLASCTSTGECVRYTDCDEGLTCAYGRCVVAPPQMPGDDASDGASDAVVEGSVPDGPTDSSSTDALDDTTDALVDGSGLDAGDAADAAGDVADAAGDVADAARDGADAPAD